MSNIRSVSTGKKIYGHIACFVAYAIFGINIVTCKDLTSSHIISPIALFCIRSFCAGSIFWFISIFTRKEKVAAKDFAKIFAAAVLGFFLTQLTFLMAIPDITPMNCSIISALSPIYTMIIAAFAIKEPITVKKAGGVMLSFCGIIYLIMNSVSADGGASSTNMRGIILMFVNSICFSLYLGLFKPLIQRYSVITFMKWIFLFSLIMSLPLAASDLMHTEFERLTAPMYADLGVLVIGATFISYLFIPIAQKTIRPTLVSMYSYMQPIMAISISIWIGMDQLTWQKILAVCTVFAGVILVSFSKSADSNSR